MISTISNHLIDWLIHEGVLQPADRELYVYAAYCFLFAWSPLFLLFTISVCIRRLPEALLLILPFITIRKFSGGFHAKTARTCLIISCTLLASFMYMTIHISACLSLYIALVLASVSLMINSPIISPQRPATPEDLKHFRHIVIAAIMLYNCCILILNHVGFSHWAVCLSLGLILSASLQIPCIINKIKLP